jgi:Fe2+ transport system protein FeoA
MKTAAELKPGESAIVTDVDNDHPSSHRLLEVGFTPGQEIQFISGAIFNDPMAFSIRGTIVAIRKNEASCIMIKQIQ